jgi:predicted enzyme related to lactoylglutathione lyase
MGKRESYTPGTFSWSDLATTDPDAAKAFYGELFGWVAEDMPVGEGVFYSMMRRDGSDAAAIAPQQEAQREAGVPPMWNSYVTVASADATAARVAELGGTVAAPAFDVMDAGRMAVLMDPQGAMFMAWEPGGNIGAGVVNGPGALSWNELSTTDMDAAAAFYGDLFGWTTSSFEGSPEPYLLIQNGERSNGGIHAISQPGAPPSWLVYFGVDDIDASLALIERLGGGTIVGSTDIGVAKIAVVTDPQGAAFAIYAGAFED